MAELVTNCVGDARGQSPEVLKQRRLEVVRLHERRLPLRKIASQTGLSLSAVQTAIAAYKAGGKTALMPKPRGRKPGSGRRLTPAQEAEIQALISTRQPRAYGLEDRLWSRRAVARLLKVMRLPALTDRAVGVYLERWRMALSDADMRRAPQVRTWLEKYEALLKARAHREEVPMYWLHKPIKMTPLPPPTTDSDSSGFMGQRARRGKAESADGANDKHEGGSEVWPGKPPPLAPRRFISASDSQGRLLWRISREGTHKADAQRKFVKVLVADAGKHAAFLLRYGMNTYRPWDMHGLPKEVALFPDDELGSPCSNAREVGRGGALPDSN